MTRSAPMTLSVVTVPEGDAPELAVGSIVGDYLVTNRIGKGAFADVYLARQISLDLDESLRGRRRHPFDHSFFRAP